jgi:dimethyladenosine transferase 1
MAIINNPSVRSLSGLCMANSIASSVSLDLLPSTSQLLKLYNVVARKDLSQNFLLHQGTNDKIARALPKENLDRQLWIEIGPGPGCLTRSLLKSSIMEEDTQTGSCSILAIEKDDRMDPILAQLSNLSKHRLQYIMGDALDLLDKPRQIQDFCRERFKSLSWPPRHIQIVGNLPFQVSSPLLIKLLRAMSHDSKSNEGDANNGWLSDPNIMVTLTFMFQREVAERITAPLYSNENPLIGNSKSIGRLSFMSNFVCDTRLLFHVHSGQFFPEPKVDASMIQLLKRKHSNERGVSFDDLEKVARLLFSERRKTIRNIVKRFHNAENVLIPSIIRELHDNERNVNIEGRHHLLELRPQDLSMDQMIHLTHLIKTHCL